MWMDLGYSIGSAICVSSCLGNELKPLLRPLLVFINLQKELCENRPLDQGDQSVLVIVAQLIPSHNCYQDSLYLVLYICERLT